MDVIRACLCFYGLYPFLFAQLSHNLPNILFNLPVYCHPTILWRKNYVILASPCCVLQCFDILLFHMKRPPGFIVAVGRPQLYSTRSSFALYNFFTLPGRAGGCPFAEANKTTTQAQPSGCACPVLIRVIRRSCNRRGYGSASSSCARTYPRCRTGPPSPVPAWPCRGRTSTRRCRRDDGGR